VNDGNWSLAAEAEGQYFEDPPAAIGPVVAAWTSLRPGASPPRFVGARLVLGAPVAAVAFVVASYVCGRVADPSTHLSRHPSDLGFAAAGVAWVVAFLAVGPMLGAGVKTCWYVGKLGVARFVRVGRKVGAELVAFADIASAKAVQHGDFVTYAFVGRAGQPVFTERARGRSSKLGEATVAAWKSFSAEAGDYSAAPSAFERIGPKPESARQRAVTQMLTGLAAVVIGVAMPLVAAHLGATTIFIGAGGIGTGIGWFLVGVVGLVRDLRRTI
jgi:hypothetical protein